MYDAEVSNDNQKVLLKKVTIQKLYSFQETQLHNMSTKVDF